MIHLSIKAILIICIILIICTFAGIAICRHNDYRLDGNEHIWPWFAYLFLIIALIVCIILLLKAIFLIKEE